MSPRKPAMVEALRKAQAALERSVTHDNKLHEALGEATGIRHAFSGMVGGLAGGFERADKKLGIPSLDATEAEAKALIESANPDRAISAHWLALEVWKLLKPLWVLEEAHRAWLRKDDEVHTAMYDVAQLLPEGAAEDVVADWEAMGDHLETFVESMNRLKAALERRDKAKRERETP